MFPLPCVLDVLYLARACIGCYAVLRCFGTFVSKVQVCHIVCYAKISLLLRRRSALRPRLSKSIVRGAGKSVVECFVLEVPQIYVYNDDRMVD